MKNPSKSLLFLLLCSPGPFEIILVPSNAEQMTMIRLQNRLQIRLFVTVTSKPISKPTFAFSSFRHLILSCKDLAPVSTQVLFISAPKIFHPFFIHKLHLTTHLLYLKETIFSPNFIDHLWFIQQEIFSNISICIYYNILPHIFGFSSSSNSLEIVFSTEFNSLFLSL